VTCKPKPPVPPRALSDEEVVTIDGLVKIGLPQARIAEHLGKHPRTVMVAVNRKGAYAHIPKPQEELK
jgi:IS30 family transposase